MSKDMKKWTVWAPLNANPGEFFEWDSLDDLLWGPIQKHVLSKTQLHPADVQFEITVRRVNRRAKDKPNE